MTSKKMVTVSFQETRASWEIINRHIDGLVFGELLTPTEPELKKVERHTHKRRIATHYRRGKLNKPNSSE